jgi:hypothetical protein
VVTVLVMVLVMMLVMMVLVTALDIIHVNEYVIYSYLVPGSSLFLYCTI